MCFHYLVLQLFGLKFTQACRSAMASSSCRPWVAQTSAAVVESASSSSDEPFVVVNAAPVKRGKKRRYEQVLADGGPMVLALVLGQPKGRWWPELNGDAKACRAASKLVSAAAGDDVLGCPMDTDTDRLVGLAILRGWRCVRGEVSHADAYALIQASEAFHRKRGDPRYLEHDVVAATTVQASDGNSIDVARDLAAKPACIAGRILLQRIAVAGAQAVVTKGNSCGKAYCIPDLLAKWKSEYGVEASASLAWPVVAGLAAAICRGTWYCDVSVRHRRQLPGETTMAPSQPSVGQLRHFSLMEVDKALPPHVDVGANQVWDSKRGSAKGYHPEHMLASLRASLHVGNKEKVRAQLLNALRFFHPRNWRSVASTTRKLEQVPHKATNRRNIVRLDMAAMLARRQWYKANGPTYRYLAYDASPQRGLEFFATVERVVRRRALHVAASGASGSMPEVESRVLPLTVLGCGRMGLAEKTQAHIHQVWLEYGPSVADVRKASSDVRQCLSDMGTELGIADARDVVAQCIGQGGERNADVGFLYPLALVVPGPQHIIDTATQRGLEALPWWPDWQRSAKAVCQWLRPHGHRQLLQERLLSAGGDHAQAHIKSLNTACDSFAHWRWKTIATVTRDLVRKQDAVVSATSGLQSASALSSRDGGGAAAFLSAVADAEFWRRAVALGQLVAPLASYSAWLRGCDCHEAERLAGKSVDCEWQGCRASGLASRTAEVLQELDGLRRDFSGMPDMVRAASSALESLDMKMSWVQHEPYLIWQASVMLLGDLSFVEHGSALACSGADAWLARRRNAISQNLDR